MHWPSLLYCDHLWPNQSYLQARKNLRVYLAHLKKILRVNPLIPAIIHTDKESIRLHANVQFDLLDLSEQFHAAFTSSDEGNKERLFKQALSHLSSDRIWERWVFDRWLLDWMDHLEEQIREVAIWLADRAPKSGNQQEAERYRVLAQVYSEEEI